MSRKDGKGKAETSAQTEAQGGAGGELEYPVEELFLLVAQLAAQYTGSDSTSVSYEKAEQLMGAVLYCIQENDVCRQFAPEQGMQKPFAGWQQEQDENPQALRAGRPSAQEAYQQGVLRVTDKVRQAIAVYNRLMPEFDSYGNEYLADVMERGMPELFKWYDLKFAPQNTLLTLDYPLLVDLSDLTGIDRIYEFLLYIRLEQEFLRLFPAGELLALLGEYDEDYRELPQNLCQMTLFSLLRRCLIQGMGQSGDDLGAEAQNQQADFSAQKKRLALLGELWQSLQLWLTEASESGSELLKYLENARRDLAIRLENRADFSAFSND